MKSTSAPVECNCINDSCWYGTARQINTNETNEFCYQCGNITHFQGTQCTQPGSCFFREVSQKYCSNPGGTPSTAPPTIFGIARSERPHRQTARAMRRILTANVLRTAMFTTGIAATVGPAHFSPTTTFIRKQDVRNMRQDRAVVIAAPVIRRLIVQLTVIGMITCAIAMTTTRPDSPAAAVTRLTRPAPPMNVVLGLPVISRKKSVCRRLSWVVAAALRNTLRPTAAQPIISLPITIFALRVLVTTGTRTTNTWAADACCFNDVNQANALRVQRKSSEVKSWKNRT